MSRTTSQTRAGGDAASGRAARPPAPRVLRYVLACVALAATVAALVTIWGPSAPASPAPWMVATLWAAAVAAATIQVGLPVVGVGGVREHTSLLEIAAVLLMVLLSPGWAVAVAVSASVCSELLRRRELPKVAFNAATEALSIALGGSVYHLLAGPGFEPTARSIGAALLAGGVYILVAFGMFTGLVAMLSGRPWDAARSQEMTSSMVVSCALAATGVLAAVLAVTAPVALPLLAVPTALDFLLGRVRQTGLELAASKEAAEAANNAKSDFLARMSHELRTPLNAVLGFGQLLERDGRLPGDAKEHAQHIIGSGRHLLTVIEEVLDISRSEVGRLDLTLRPVLVAAVAAESLAMIRPLAQQRDLTVDLVVAEEDLHASADAHRLRQVLVNLLGNAVKYNREGGDISVTIRCSADAAMVDVRDTGPGIAEADLARLFVPFERLTARDSGIEGTGLGLSVARLFVEAMDGRLDVATQLGRGTTFTVTLPRAPTPIGAHVGEPDDTPTPRP